MRGIKRLRKREKNTLHQRTRKWPHERSLFQRFGLEQTFLRNAKDFIFSSLPLLQIWPIKKSVASHISINNHRQIGRFYDFVTVHHRLLTDPYHGIRIGVEIFHGFGRGGRGGWTRGPIRLSVRIAASVGTHAIALPSATARMSPCHKAAAAAATVGLLTFLLRDDS